MRLYFLFEIQYLFKCDPTALTMTTRIEQAGNKKQNKNSMMRLSSYFKTKKNEKTSILDGSWNEYEGILNNDCFSLLIPQIMHIDFLPLFFVCLMMMGWIDETIINKFKLKCYSSSEIKINNTVRSWNAFFSSIHFLDTKIVNLYAFMEPKDSLWISAYSQLQSQQDNVISIKHFQFL